jgi:carbonyl reductase 1
MSSQPLFEEKWWTNDTVAIVTGASRGIGKEIARMLANQGLTTVLTATNESKASQAAEEIKSNIKTRNPNVFSHQLDLSDKTSIDTFITWAESTFSQGITILINNAGFAYKGNTWGPSEADRTIQINYRGTADLTEGLLPLFFKGRTSSNTEGGGGHIVYVSSTAGRLSIFSFNDEYKSKLQTASSRDDIDSVADGFVEAVKNDTWRRQGLPESMYGVSKACMTAHSKLMAKEIERRSGEGERITVTSCHPGYCATDMSSFRGPRPAAEGADVAVWLALRVPNEKAKSGGFYIDREEVEW